jgi:hypothetical protein
MSDYYAQGFGPDDVRVIRARDGVVMSRHVSYEEALRYIAQVWDASVLEEIDGDE